MVRPCPCRLRRISQSASRAWGIEAHGRLVEKEDLRLVDQGSGDHQPLLLAPGQLVYLGFGPVGEAHALQQLPGPGQGGGPGNPEVGRVEEQVLDRGELEVRVRALGNDPDPPLDPDRIAAHVDAGHRGRAGRRPDPGGQNADCGGLARAVGPEQPEEFPRRHLEIETVERQDLPDAGIRGGGGARHHHRGSAQAAGPERRGGVDLAERANLDGGGHDPKVNGDR